MRYLPLSNRAMYVWLEGQPVPKGADAAPHVGCPVCNAEADERVLAAVEDERLKSAADSNKAWERDSKLLFTRVETRHGDLHLQLPPKDAHDVGILFERLHERLQKHFGSMRFSLTRPANYELVGLFGKASYDRFRATMERRYTREQLGEGWALSRDAMAWDHALVPFFYETPQTIDRRRMYQAVCFLGGRRAVQLASGYRAPAWLQEGFAEYCEELATGRNLWRSVYNQNPGPPPGDWLKLLRQAAAAKSIRPWSMQVLRGLRDWDAVDYLQTFGMVWYLVSGTPKEFLAYVRFLAEGKPEPEALASAYRQSVDQLDAAFQKWLLGGGLPQPLRAAR